MQRHGWFGLRTRLPRLLGSGCEKPKDLINTVGTGKPVRYVSSGVWCPEEYLRESELTGAHTTNGGKIKERMTS